MEGVKGAGCAGEGGVEKPAGGEELVGVEGFGPSDPGWGAEGGGCEQEDEAGDDGFAVAVADAARGGVAVPDSAALGAFVGFDAGEVVVAFSAAGFVSDAASAEAVREEGEGEEQECEGGEEHGGFIVAERGRRSADGACVSAEEVVVGERGWGVGGDGSEEEGVGEGFKFGHEE